jgi:hypothetical protein
LRSPISRRLSKAALDHIDSDAYMEVQQAIQAHQGAGDGARRRRAVEERTRQDLIKPVEDAMDLTMSKTCRSRSGDELIAYLVDEQARAARKRTRGAALVQVADFSSPSTKEAETRPCRASRSPPRSSPWRSLARQTLKKYEQGRPPDTPAADTLTASRFFITPTPRSKKLSTG